jgi:hypothetical protein
MLGAEITPTSWLPNTYRDSTPSAELAHPLQEIPFGVARRMANQLGIATAAHESVLLPDR